MNRRKAILLALALIIIGAGAGYVYHARVRNDLTAQDRASLAGAARRFQLSPVKQNASYEDEIRLIASAQKAVLALAPGNEGIPMETGREPADLFARGSGLCYDRSRSMEKLLRYLGFETRHVSVYAAPAEGWAFSALLKSGTPSHAVSEAKTKKGWLLLDSNAAWMALDAQGEPVAAAQMAEDAAARKIAWQDPGINPIFQKPFVYVYGLYSRHGKFYPPYNPIPDLNWGELGENF